MRTVTPTRSNLRAIEKRIHFAQRGHDVLQRKLEGLVLEFFDVLDRYETLQVTADEAYATAQSRLDHVRALVGAVELAGVARARPTTPTLTVDWRNVMGVRVPLIESGGITLPLADHGYGLLGTSGAVDATVDAYETLLESVVDLAEAESTVERLVAEIETTKRHVNALEQVILPDLRADRRSIRRKLDERELQEHVRLRWSKARRERSRRWR